MSQPVSETDLCNWALTKLGADRITSRTDGSANASACDAIFDRIRDAELRRYNWSFATKQATLAAVTPAPSWGRSYAYQLPTDFLRLRAPYPEDNSNSLDWQIQGDTIVTDSETPFEILYTARITDTTLMDPLFHEALVCKLALELCEELTQSNSKKADLKEQYREAIRDARRANSMERIAREEPEDDWIAARDQ